MEAAAAIRRALIPRPVVILSALFASAARAESADEKDFSAWN
jgi:hypothetical protein